MQLLIFLNWRFWLGAAIAGLALYSEWAIEHVELVLAGVAVIAFVGLFIGYVIKTRKGK